MASPSVSPIAVRPNQGRTTTARLGRPGLISSSSRATTTNSARPRSAPSARPTLKAPRSSTLTSSAAKISSKTKTARIPSKLQTATASSKAKAVAASTNVNPTAVSTPAKAVVNSRRGAAQASPKILAKGRAATDAYPKAKPVARRPPASPNKTQTPGRSTSSTTSRSRPSPVARLLGKSAGVSNAKPRPAVTKATSASALSAASKTTSHHASTLSHVMTQPMHAASGSIALPPATLTMPSNGARSGRSVAWAARA